MGPSPFRAKGDTSFSIVGIRSAQGPRAPARPHHANGTPPTPPHPAASAPPSDPGDEERALWRIARELYPQAGARFHARIVDILGTFLLIITAMPELSRKKLNIHKFAFDLREHNLLDVTFRVHGMGAVCDVFQDAFPLLIDEGLIAPTTKSHYHPRDERSGEYVDHIVYQPTRRGLGIAARRAPRSKALLARIARLTEGHPASTMSTRQWNKKVLLRWVGHEENWLYSNDDIIERALRGRQPFGRASIQLQRFLASSPFPVRKGEGGVSPRARAAALAWVQGKETHAGSSMDPKPLLRAYRAQGAGAIEGQFVGMRGYVTAKESATIGGSRYTFTTYFGGRSDKEVTIDIDGALAGGDAALFGHELGVCGVVSTASGRPVVHAFAIIAGPPLPAILREAETSINEDANIDQQAWERAIANALLELRRIIQRNVAARDYADRLLPGWTSRRGVSTPDGAIRASLAAWKLRQEKIEALEVARRRLAGIAPHDDPRPWRALIRTIDELGRECEGAAWVYVRHRAGAY